MVAWLDELVKMISLLPAAHRNSVVLNPSDAQILHMQLVWIKMIKNELSNYHHCQSNTSVTWTGQVGQRSANVENLQWSATEVA